MHQSGERGGSTLSGVLLVGGTAIGAGMLAMPVMTGGSGFYPALLINGLCWLLMVGTGLLLLEVSLWMGEGAHILSMTRRFLGRGGEVLGGSIYLFLYFSLMVSYFSGGAPLVHSLLERGGGGALSPLWGHALLLFVFGGIVWLGAAAIDRLNTLLIGGLVLAYCSLLLVGSQGVRGDFLARSHWPTFFWAAPTLFGAYGFHNVIPSMTGYLNRNGKKLRVAIVGGSLLSLAVYVMWQWMVLGSLSVEALSAAAEKGVSVAEVLQQASQSEWVPTLSTFFAFFAIVTSLLGVSFSMVDFLGDGLGVKERTGWRRMGLCALVFLPPLLFALANPGIFVSAIGFAGGFGEGILNGIFPVVMVWVGRYHMGLSSSWQLPGGKGSLLFLGGGSAAVVIIEGCALWGF